MLLKTSRPLGAKPIHTLKYAVQLVQNNNKKDDESERCCAMPIVTYS